MLRGVLCFTIPSLMGFFKNLSACVLFSCNNSTPILLRLIL